MKIKQLFIIGYNWLKEFYKKYFSRQHYIDRHFIIIFFFVTYVITMIIRTIVSGFDNVELQQQAQKNSVQIVTKTGQRGYIFDRNNIILAGNILVSNVILDPPNQIESVGFNNVTSIWRIKDDCVINKKEFGDKCHYNNLAKRAKRLFNNNKIEDNFIIAVNFPDLIVQTLQVDKSLLTYILNMKKSCYKIKNKKIILKDLGKDDNFIMTEINKMSTCVKYKIIKKKLLFTGEIIQNLQKLKQEKFLLCTIKQKAKSNKQKIKDSLFGWIFGIDKAIYSHYCKVKKIHGITIQNSTKRFYPQAENTTPLIGAVNNNDDGVFGLEKIFDHILKGKTYQNKIKKDNNSWINHYQLTTIDDSKIDGKDLILTIDAKVQFHLFNAIKKSVDKFKAKSGAGIILSPNGEIIAIASYPTSNANNSINSINNYSHYINRPLSDNIDIASIIKPFIALMALENGVVKKNELINITKGEGIAKFRPKKNKPFIDLRGIIKDSNSLGSIKVGKRLKHYDMFTYLFALRFGSAVDVLPEIESAGFLRNPYYWSETDKKRLSFGGYGIIQTTIAQIARAYLIFLNNGAIPSLKLFKAKQVNDSAYRIFSKNNIDYVISAMKSVVNNGGTGKKAKLNHFIAAGKTGTAQLLINGKYSNRRHNTLFAGFAPIDKPKYLMVVNIKDPDGYHHNGGSIAAPIFKEVMDKILK